MHHGGMGLILLSGNHKNNILGGGSSSGMSSTSAAASQHHQPSMYRGYSPGKPKWKGSNGQNMIMGGGPGSTGFSYQAPGSMMSGVMTTSGYPMRPS